MKKTRSVLAALLALMMVFAATAAFAQSLWQRGAENLLMEDDTYISTMTTMGGKLYTIKSGALYEMTAESEQAPIAQVKYRCDWDQDDWDSGVSLLLTDGEKLYGLNITKMVLYLLTPAGDTVTREQVLALALEDEDIYTAKAFITQGKLVALTNQSLLVADIVSGDMHTLDATDLRALCAYKADACLGIVFEPGTEKHLNHIVKIDLNTGVRSTLATHESSIGINQLAYDAKTDTAYFADSSRIFQYPVGGAITQAASFVRGDSDSLSLIDSHFAAITVDGNILAIRALDPDKAAEQTQLVLFEEYGRAVEYAGFIKQYSDVDLVFYQNDNASVEETFVNHMAAGIADVDIFVLKDPTLLDAIKRKSYALDLSQSESLKAKVQDMYTPLTEAFQDSEGHIVAAPKEYILPMLSYNPTAFAALGLPVPKTYRDYFELCQAWLTDLGTEHPEYYLSPLENELDIAALLKRYTIEMQKNGKPVDYQSPVLKDVITRYLTVAALPPLPFSEGAEFLIYTMDIPNKGAFDYMPLTFESDNHFVFDSSQSLCYFVVNPYSRHPEQALDFLASYLNDMGDFFSFAIFRSYADTLKDIDYQKDVSRIQAELDTLLAQADTAEPAEKRDLDILIEQKQQELSLYLEKAAYEKDAHSVASYLPYADSAYINTADPIAPLYAAAPETFEMTDVDRLLKEVSEKVERMILERE